MTTDTPGAPHAHDHASRHDPVYDELHESADFVELRRRFRIFVFPATAAFLSWYLLYVVMSIALVAVVVVQRATLPVRRVSRELQARAEGDLTPIAAADAPRPSRS